MEKIEIKPNIFIYPNPVTLLGVTYNDKANFMALGWISRVNANPPMVGVSVNNSHYSTRGILATKTFSINTPSADMIAQTDYCGLVSGKNTDKSELFTIFYGKLKTAPMIQACPLCFECKLFDLMEMETNTLFVGEIISAYADEQCLTAGSPDIKKINPLLLTMPDNHYWTVGEQVGKAWSIGKRLKTD